VWVAFSRKDEDREQVRPTAFKPTWMSDVDYDGFDWGEAKDAFRWDDGKLTYYKDLASFAQAVGIERNGVRVRKEELFEKYNLPATPGRVAPPLLALRKGCNTIDAGTRLPNLNDDFVGKAPDLGAHEYGLAPLTYGPRPRTPEGGRKP
jgi:hypothetical protein